MDVVVVVVAVVVVIIVLLFDCYFFLEKHSEGWKMEEMRNRDNDKDDQIIGESGMKIKNHHESTFRRFRARFLSAQSFRSSQSFL